MYRLATVAVGFLMLASPATAGLNAYVLGDSIGEGVAIASGLKGLARISVHIRGPKALAQIGQTPTGSTVFIVLGTNDAEGSIVNIGRSIDDIVKAGDRKQLSMIWIGPHCVRRPWDARARELDEFLRTRLADTSVKYVSMRDSRMCAGSFHEPDGVHLTMGGYRYMWEKARSNVGFPTADFASGSPPKAAAVPGDDETAESHQASVPAPSTTVSRPQIRAQSSGVKRRLVTEIHTPLATPWSPLVWVKAPE
jgi:hypothetical protein